MRRWAIPVMIVFWLMLGLSLTPLHAWLLPGRPPAGGETAATVPLFRYPVVMSWAAMLALAQAVLLIRVRPDGERPQARRKLWPAIIAAAFCFALLTAGLVISVAMAAAGDESMSGIQASANWIDRTVPGLNADRWLPVILFFGFIGGMWAVWWIVLGRALRASAPESFPAKLLTWILAGSVLELLIAVPSHLICRRRDDCCAPVLTFWGMAMGWAIVLLSLGPAVALLIEQRIARKTRQRLPSELGQQKDHKAQPAKGSG